MDISDILQDLNARHLDRDPFADGDDYNDGRPSGQEDLQALTRAWVNERGAVELLPYNPLPSIFPGAIAKTSPSDGPQTA